MWTFLKVKLIGLLIALGFVTPFVIPHPVYEPEPFVKHNLIQLPRKSAGVSAASSVIEKTPEAIVARIKNTKTTPHKVGGITSTTLPVSEDSYFAHIVSTNAASYPTGFIVDNVIAGKPDFIATGKMGVPSKWIQVSYSGSIGGVYVGIGYGYDPTNDQFYPPQPYPSFIFNAVTDTWSPPTPRIDSSTVWNEKTKSWVTPSI